MTPGTENENAERDGNDLIRADNAFLKLKLEMDHHMEMSELSQLDPILENQFLSHILEFEKHYQRAAQVSVHDYLGRPSFRHAEELSTEEISAELKRIREVMDARWMVLDSIHDYPDEIIYRFITEELFLVETDDFVINGMTKHFIYEEFHPEE